VSWTKQTTTTILHFWDNLHSTTFCIASRGKGNFSKGYDNYKIVLFTIPDSSKTPATYLLVQISTRFYVETSHFTTLTMVTFEMAGRPLQSPLPLSLTHLSPTICQKYISSNIQANAPQHCIVCNLQHPSTKTHVAQHGTAIDDKCFPTSMTMIFTNPPIHSTPSPLLSHNPDCQWNA